MKIFKKKYKATAKIRYEFTKAYAMESLRNKYIEANKDSRAIECAIMAEKHYEKAWVYVFELYPKLKGKKIVYSRYEGLLKKQS